MYLLMGMLMHSNAYAQFATILHSRGYKLHFPSTFQWTYALK